jgi:hypothetical protein
MHNHGVHATHFIFGRRRLLLGLGPKSFERRGWRLGAIQYFNFSRHVD